MARCKAAAGTIFRSKHRLPINKCTSIREKGVVSDEAEPDVYSHGRSKKKNASTTMSAIAAMLVMPDA